MQERIVGLMGERSMLIDAISHDFKTYLTRMRLRAERVAEPDRRTSAPSGLRSQAERQKFTPLGHSRGPAR